MFFAAIEVKPGEAAHDAVKAFMCAASDVGTLFTRLKLYGPLTVGSTEFVRFASDCLDYSQPLLKRLRGEARSVILPSKVGYLVFMSDGRSAQFSTSQMQSVHRPGYGQTYKGPKVEFWERQFA